MVIDKEKLGDIDFARCIGQIRTVSPWFPRWMDLLREKGFSMEEIINFYIDSVDETELMSHLEVYSLFSIHQRW